MARLKRRPPRRPPSGPVREESTLVNLDGRAVPVRVRRDPRARRLTLRIDTRSADAVVTVPPHVAALEAAEMVRRKAGWVLSRLDALTPRVEFVDGARVPVLGEALPVRHRPDARRGVWEEDGAVHVSGAPEHLARRLTDWLKRRARAEIAPRVAVMAAALGREPGRLSIRDTRSRWGSCSARGDLSFSWRLVMAPPWVLDYVVAHEVAHLAHLNHGTNFWTAVAQLTDDTTAARTWLRRHGPALHRYG